MWDVEIPPIAFPLAVILLFFPCIQVARIFSSSSHMFPCGTFQMDPPSTPYIGYADGASCYSQNLASTAWAIFTPLHSPVMSNSVCIGATTNNQAEYDAAIGFLANALDRRILHLHVHLYSLFLFMQLNGVYRGHNPIVFRRYL